MIFPRIACWFFTKNRTDSMATTYGDAVALFGEIKQYAGLPSDRQVRTVTNYIVCRLEKTVIRRVGKKPFLPTLVLKPHEEWILRRLREIILKRFPDIAQADGTPISWLPDAPIPARVRKRRELPKRTKSERKMLKRTQGRQPFWY
jgi:hypothetical protein